jgi:hypothetical protein
MKIDSIALFLFLSKAKLYNRQSNLQFNLQLNKLFHYIYRKLFNK